MAVQDLPTAEYESWSTENLEQLVYIAQRERGNPDVERELTKVLLILAQRGTLGKQSDYELAEPR